MGWKRILLVALVVLIGVGCFYRVLLQYKGIRVTSWWRSPWHNYTVGGNWLSLHMIGWAFDIIPVNAAVRDVLNVWMPWAKFVVESDHIHIQLL